MAAFTGGRRRHPDGRTPPPVGGETAIKARTGHDVHYVDHEDDLFDVADALQGADVVAIDTESNSLHVYREQVCFMQIAVEDEVFLVDTVALRDLSPLEGALSDPRTVKILHGADYDVVCLKRDFGIALQPIFDTMIAAQMLGYEQLGLAALVDRHFEVTLDKSHSRHDWGARPVEDRYLPYLVDDVVYLEELRALLTEELEEADIEEEAGLEFARVADQEWSGRESPDPEGFRRIKGANDLDRPGLSILKELYLLRERLSERANRPPFKVIGNAQLLAIADTKPRSPQHLRRLPGFPDRVVRRLSRQLLDAVTRGLKNRNDVPFRIRGPGPPPEEQIAIDEGLRRWRRAECEERGVPSLVVLPNHVIDRIARVRPATPEDLLAIPGLGPKRCDRYAEAILRIVRDPPPPPRRRR